MDTPLVIFALIAIVAMGMMVFADAEITGQPTIRFPKKVIQKITEKQNPPPSNTGPVCNCPSYGDKILTVDEGSKMFAGLSQWDCMLINEIIKLRKELKKSTVHLDSWANMCKVYGW